MAQPFASRPRLDWRAVIIGMLLALAMAVGIWYFRAHALRTATPQVQPLVPNSNGR